MDITYEILKNQIINKLWLGKEIFFISEQVSGAIERDREWLSGLPPVNFILSQTEPAWKPLKDIMDGIQENTDVVAASALLFLQSSHGVNKRLNSKAPKSGTDVFGDIRVSDNDRSLYNNCIRAYNQTLNLPVLSEKVAQYETEIKNIQEMANGTSIKEDLENLQSSALRKLLETKRQIETNIKSLEGKQRRVANALLYKINSSIKKIKESWGIDIEASGGSGGSGKAPFAELAYRGIYRKMPEIMNSSFEINSISHVQINSIRRYPDIQMSALAPVIPALPSVGGIVGVIIQMATWLLGDFLLKSVIGFPSALLGTLTNVTSSIVCKYFLSAGAEGCAQIAADILKANLSSLPAIFSATTGMMGAAWSFLTIYAPYIILAAVIIIIAIKLTEKKEIDYAPIFYIVGYRNGTADYAIGRFEGEIKVPLIELLIDEGKDFIENTGKEYNELYGFLVKEEVETEKVAEFGLKMTDLTKPEEMPEEERHIRFQKVRLDLGNFWESEPGGFSESDFETD